jgi:phage terminase small subunit
MADTPPPSEGTPEGDRKKAGGPVLPRPQKALNPRQTLFVAQYLVDLNATQAAIRAGYSVNRASEIGCQLLRIPKVAAAVRERLNAQLVRVDANSEKVLRETCLVAFSSIADYSLSRDGVLRLASPGVDPAAIRAVSSYKRKERVLRRKVVDESTTEELVEIETEIKMYDKVRAIGYLLQHLGLIKQPTPAVADDPIKELLRRLPANIASELGAVLASAASPALGIGNGGPDPEPNGSGDDGGSGVHPVSE